MRRIHRRGAVGERMSDALAAATAGEDWQRRDDAAAADRSQVATVAGVKLTNRARRDSVTNAWRIWAGC